MKRLLSTVMTIGRLIWHNYPVCDRAIKAPEQNRTPEEVKARKKAYKRRKAAKVARRRNRK